MSLTISVTPSARKSIWVTPETLDMLEEKIRSFEHVVTKGEHKSVTFDDTPEETALCCTIVGPPTELRCSVWKTSSNGTMFETRIRENDDMGMLVESIEDVLSY